MSHSSRRRNIVFALPLAALAATVAAPVRQAAAKGRGFTLSASTEGKCITCRYWGGVRKISKDRKSVTAETLGWCNNPDSEFYLKTTTPETGPMKTWRKWTALG